MRTAVVPRRVGDIGTSRSPGGKLPIAGDAMVAARPNPTLPCTKTDGRPGRARRRRADLARPRVGACELALALL